MKVPLAAILRALRAHKGLTQESIPEGGNRQYLSQLEHGKSSPTLDKLQDLSEAYGASPLLLVGAATLIQEGITVDAIVGRFAEQMRELNATGTLAAARAELDDNGLRSRPAGRVIDRDLKAAIQECKAQGLSQAQTSQNLGVNKMTVSRYWRESE
ncbi:helix-turn-helix transcriptional regulator [Pseudomonas veronii]|uniref:helix-turn-helix domain-containing protein n=1 Tax=Pseudomonas veronii TaxID=76761 RepID=UPI001E3CF220|nr:helix-turn-helix transcriptional regulator [Pseudomonas veronii]UHH33025.1 helix-turn-helix transcriptional regulator [Pseudomonas veronii]